MLLTKHFTYSLWRMTQTNGMTFNNDAKSCYDHIVMNLALLASQKLGMPTSICDWYNKFLQQANYHIQLPTLVSSQYYNHQTHQPLHGPGQGSRAAPSLWVIVSSIIMHCMGQQSHGIQFQDPHGNTKMDFITTGFVDDTTHWINNFIQAIQGQQTLETLYQDTKKNCTMVGTTVIRHRG